MLGEEREVRGAWAETVEAYCVAFLEALTSSRVLMWLPYVSLSIMLHYTVYVGTVALFDGDEKHTHADGTPHSNVLEARERRELDVSAFYVSCLLTLGSFASQMYVDTCRRLEEQQQQNDSKQHRLLHTPSNLLVVPLVSIAFACMMSMAVLALDGGLLRYTLAYSVAFLLAHLVLVYLYVWLELERLHRKEK